jgi:hypothetical protein
LPTGMFMSLIWSGRILVDALLPLLLLYFKIPAASSLSYRAL